MTARSIALFIAAAIAEIAGAYLVWVGIKEHEGPAFVALGAMALTAYGVVAAYQPSHEFGRVLAAYGGVFIAGSLLCGVALDGFHPDPRQPRHPRRVDLPRRRWGHHVRPLPPGPGITRGASRRTAPHRARSAPAPARRSAPSRSRSLRRAPRRSPSRAATNA